ncbi:cytochrome c [Fretibacter rubidus]|uniref:c-type cytochrome n=1 Tax=Fretibacter rubidus TaxID=570162 RepID=UPI00352BA96D
MRKFAFIAAFIVTACQPAVQAEPDELPRDTLSKAATLSASCSGCHGGGSLVVNLSGWSEAALHESLTSYQTSRGDSVMHRYARGLSDNDITLIAGYLGAAE